MFVPFYIVPRELPPQARLDRVIMNWNLKHPDDPIRFQAPPPELIVNGKKIKLNDYEYNKMLTTAGKIALNQLSGQRFDV